MMPTPQHEIIRDLEAAAARLRPGELTFRCFVLQELYQRRRRRAVPPGSATYEVMLVNTIRVLSAEMERRFGRDDHRGEIADELEEWANARAPNELAFRCFIMQELLCNRLPRAVPPEHAVYEWLLASTMRALASEMRRRFGPHDNDEDIYEQLLHGG